MKSTPLFATLCAATLLVSASPVRADENDNDLVHLVPKGLGVVKRGIVRGFKAAFGPDKTAQQPVPPPPPPPPQVESAETPIPAGVGACKQAEWKSLDANNYEQPGCEVFPYTVNITDYKATAGQDVATLLKKFGPKGVSLAETLENNPVSNGFIQEGDGKLDQLQHSQVSALIRQGYIPESPDRACKGNILYLEGLSDSMQDHLPLFKMLSAAGYRVIAFDYMGQGGSRNGDASADNIRIEDIPSLGEQVYQRFHNPRCGKKIIMGWSLGGLAAYYWASDRMSDQSSVQAQLTKATQALENMPVERFKNKHTKEAAQWAMNELAKFLARLAPDPTSLIQKLPPGPSPAADNKDIAALILIAPALAPQLLPGKTDSVLTFTEITKDIFTPSVDGQNNYVDRLVPSSVKEVPTLASDAFINSVLARAVHYYDVPATKYGNMSLQDVLGARIRLAAWTIPDGIKGLVLIAGSKDKLVDSDAVTKEGPEMAPKFTWVSYGQTMPKLDPPAMHGLDNERPDVSQDVQRRILGFLNDLESKR
jgi:hypothetical protein